MATTVRAAAASTTAVAEQLHAGYIRLELPVFHVGYFKNIIAILQCVCKTCAHVMVPEDERRQYLRRFRSPQTEVRRLHRPEPAPEQTDLGGHVPQVNTRRALFKKLMERCKRFKACPFCGATQGAPLPRFRAIRHVLMTCCGRCRETRRLCAENRARQVQQERCAAGVPLPVRHCALLRC